MRALQFLHLPRKSAYEKRGTLSRGLMGSPHAGQCEVGKTTDWRKGTRWITTLRKLPAISPSRPATRTIKPHLLAGPKRRRRPRGSHRRSISKLSRTKLLSCRTPDILLRRLEKGSKTGIEGSPGTHHVPGEGVAHRPHVGLCAGPDPLGLDPLVEQHPSARDR